VNVDILDWQRRFRAGPAVWVVLDPDGEPCEFYESREAAECHLRWEQARGHKRYGIQRFQVHTLDLARERWATPTDAGERGKGT
jgi:hypothetical protein